MRKYLKFFLEIYIFFISFFPVIIVGLFSIWPPAAMVHEIFGSYYFAFSFRTSNFIAETGYGALALLSYPPYLFVKFFNATSLYQKMLIYSYGFYILYGLLLFLMFNWILKKMLKFQRFFYYLLFL